MIFEKKVMSEKRGQLTIFIVIAVMILAAVAVFFVVRSDIISTQIPVEMEPVYNNFLTCLEQDVEVGVNLLGSQAGYIELPEFEPGSTYMPFSSQLDFLGNPVPYWYYVSGNNIQKEQVPSLNEMEQQLSDFIEERIVDCEFEEYYEQGFEITLSDSSVDSNINDDNVQVNLDMDLTISRNNETITVSNHESNINSNLGNLYQSALEVYEYEQESLFLERYAIDTLRLYAPVDGVEIQCSPIIWPANEVMEEVRNGVQENTLTLRKGSPGLADEEDRYFLQDLDIDGDLRLINSVDWPYTFEVTPAEGNLLVSEPIGNQQGLGVLGFCYVPYHFVYDLKYPVLVQVYQDDEIFQFPMAVVVEKNNPRESLDVTAIESETIGICEQKNTPIEVDVYDSQLNKVNANISYECFGASCQIGQTVSGTLNSDFPQCANGFIIAEAEGFKDKKYQFSTVESGSVEIILDRSYEMNVDLRLNNLEYGGEATISFISDESSRTIAYPTQNTVELSEGQYKIQVSIYRNSSLTLPSTTSEQCTEVPSSGIGGLFGFTEEKCFNIDFPSQVVSSSLSGGGQQNYFILESQLMDSNTIQINAESFPVPSSIEQLQENYILLEEEGLIITFN